MEFIKTCPLTRDKWYYEKGIYYSKNENGRARRIKGIFLPNPEEIKTKRKEVQNTLPLSERGNYRTQPHEITTFLWNHWNSLTQEEKNI